MEPVLLVASEAGASAETVTGVTNDEEAKDESWKSWKSYQKTMFSGKSMENQQDPNDLNWDLDWNFTKSAVQHGF